MTSKKEFNDWKQSLRKSLYEYNQTQLRTYYSQKQQAFESLLNLKDQALINLNSFILNQEDFLPDYANHKKIQNFIQIKHKIYTKSDLDYFLPVCQKNKSLKRNIIMKEALNLLKQAKNQSQAETVWLYIISRYTCPLDLLMKCEIYFEFLKFGTSLLSLLKFIYCRQMKISAFLQSVLHVKKYIQSTKNSEKCEKTQQKFNLNHFCAICSCYCCIRHHSLSETEKCWNFSGQQEFTSRRNHSLSYFQLLADIREIIEFDYIEKQKKNCSLECYRRMRKQQFLQLYSSCTSLDLEKVTYIKMTLQMYGFLPCQISKIVKMRCSDLAIYLLLSHKTSSIARTFGLAENQYLKCIQKYEKRQQIMKCFCRKGQCLSDKCPCFDMKKECSQNCSFCFHSERKQDCLNKVIFIGTRPKVRIGISQNQESLGLFTAESLKKGQSFLWKSQEILSPEEEKLRSLFKSCSKNKRQLKETSRLYGKERFLQTSQLGKENIAERQLLVDGQLYILYFATQDIGSDEQLIKQE